MQGAFLLLTIAFEGLSIAPDSEFELSAWLNSSNLSSVVCRNVNTFPVPEPPFVRKFKTSD